MLQNLTLRVGLANIDHLLDSVKESLVSLTNTWVFDAIMCYLKNCNLVNIVQPSDKSTLHEMCNLHIAYTKLILKTY